MIEIRDLKKTYERVTAVDGLTFTVERGEVFGLLGPNGAGKTTTIKILSCLTVPDSGICRIEGLDVVKERYAVKRIIGVVPQENNLDRELTCYENLKIYAMLHRVEDYERKILNSLKTVELLDKKGTLVSKLSGGMQRRLLIARAMLPSPKILFLDEPSVGLDAHVRRQLWELIRGIAWEGRTVILTTHYIEEAEALSNRVAIMNKGRLIALDTPLRLKRELGAYVVEEQMGNGKVRYHMFHSKGEAHEFARGCACQVTIRESNLEDVFIRLTGERIES
ncbi:MAG: ABC transporter ATP-binding protein [Desulfatiglandales bacterium]